MQNELALKKKTPFTSAFYNLPLFLQGKKKKPRVRLRDRVFFQYFESYCTE